MAKNLSDDMLDQMAGEAASKTLIEQAIKPTPPSGGGFFNQFVKPAVLPTVGGIAGAALGGGIGTGLGGMTIPGGIIGSGIGSALGEAGNQALGITEPSPTQIGLAGAIPMAVGGAAALATKATPFLMPGRVAQALNLIGPEAAASKLAKFSPLEKSSDLFKKAAAAQVKIPMHRTVNALDDLIEKFKPANVSSGVRRTNATLLSWIKGLNDAIKTAPEGWTPSRLQRELEGFGDVAQKLKAPGGSGSGDAQQIFKHMINDLDDAVKMANPGLPGAQTLLAARDAFKRESVVKEIGEAITDATKSLKGQGEAVQFNASTVINKLRTNDRLKMFYQQAFNDAERIDIEQLLYKVNKIPSLRPGAGQQFGFGRGGQMLAGAAAGGGIGFGTGGPMGGGVGTALGMAVPPIVELGKDFALAIQLKTGRALMKELFKQSRGSYTPAVASVISAYAQAVRNKDVSE